MEDDGGAVHDEEDERDDEAADRYVHVTHPFETDGDWELVKLVARTDGLSKGILDQLLKIFRRGPVTFRSAHELHTAVEALPGPSFQFDEIFLHPCPDLPVTEASGPSVSYELHARSVCAIVRDILTTSGDLLLDPVLHPHDHEDACLTDAKFYQDLLRQLRHSTGDATAMLVPLAFHSGSCHARLLLECALFLLHFTSVRATRVCCWSVCCASCIVRVTRGCCWSVCCILRFLSQLARR